ncbi:TetR/AcrR family transcriptional regulator [Mycobacteroides abscessus]|uniref:TetR/AcrR family transcriptional regulator n=1 Tax=Mycobacteroides abscessus TaxID=36809 RepID=UPI0005E378C8|nr:TetR/AcrR family transcriptional regulator [Mycobacteroides abscessus]MBN7301490.1 helix-turn-helix transcriptional regulator [Mycobacteroides abscessus subsp. bolletii]CPR98328.1 Putative transcriptional regulator [Mycobacteroides abscessus]CPS33966.1 Putative transcriptional regulator [Mycobacteroides abscessus]CPS36881.1 Putative transcriptional regulator [Mycobacteroides abscessus]CPS98605.1 Putative transcriptional regulator [Mycobacteroides abscessus]
MDERKATGILDAAEQLFLQFGYRKVTIDEVARRAGVGKGTIYLYWPSKLELFGAVFTRDGVAMLTAAADALRADPREVLLSVSSRRTFIATMNNPLARAIVTGDQALLGDLLTTTPATGEIGLGKLGTTDLVLRLLYRHGLLRDDPGQDPMLAYRVAATVAGFYAVENTSAAGDFGLESKADALADTLSRAFEPAEEPSLPVLEAARAEALTFYERWRHELSAVLDPSAKETAK